MTSRWQAYQSELAAVHALMLGAIPATLPRRWRPGIGLQAARPAAWPVNESCAWNWHSTETLRSTAERQ